uniref:ionotropic receptor 133 precursor n=1 Tax=Aedes aegypti TaxID=7159 RepID=UPI000C29350C|nr:ionotropic receptor 133 precursor [Aedes aegypti]
MVKVTALSVVLFVITKSSETFLTPELIDYSVSIIEYLSTKQVGTFKCIFYDFSDEYAMDGDFDRILKSPRIDHISKFVINESFTMDYHSELPQNPSLMVINMHSRNVPGNAKKATLLFTIINPNTKMLFLTDERFYESFAVLVELLYRPRQFTTIVCIETKTPMVVRIGFERLILEILNLVHPQYLFGSILRDMQGRPIRYSFPDKVSYRNENWIRATARFLNATTQYVKNTCPAPESISLGACYNEHLTSNHVLVSLHFISLKHLPPSLYRMLFDVIPETFLILVPKPRRVNIFEIFIWPFTWGSWLLLAVVLILTELVYVINPRMFQNDPILLFVCGLERCNLHRASANEKLVYFPLIIFFFLMLTAYETRIISFMINKPSVAKLHTIQQLIDSGMLLKAKKHNNPKQFEDTALSSIVRDSSDEGDLMFDGVNAYCLNGVSAYTALRIAASYDYRTKYYVLDETFGLGVGTHWMPQRDGLLEELAQTQRWLFETGILGKWERDEVDLMLVQFGKVSEMLNEMSGMFRKRQQKVMLGIRDLLPAWLALGVGLLGSFVVFVGERKSSKHEISVGF